MKFCPKCGSILVPQGNKLVCLSCGYEEKAKEMVVSENRNNNKDKIVLVKENENKMQKVKAKCPKCGNEEAYFYLEQTRAADEPPTRIYKCTKCGYSWREYD